MAFTPKIAGKNFINHIDCNPANNNFNNLEWCTISENSRHGLKYGRIRPTKGEERANALVTNETARKIKELCKTHTTPEIMRILNFPDKRFRNLIYSIRYKTAWTHI